MEVVELKVRSRMVLCWIVRWGIFVSLERWWYHWRQAEKKRRNKFSFFHFRRSWTFIIRSEDENQIHFHSPLELKHHHLLEFNSFLLWRLNIAWNNPQNLL